MSDNLFKRIFSRLPMARSTSAYDYALGLLDLPPGGRVLDLGAGRGFGSANLSQSLPGVRIFGLDIQVDKLAPKHRAGANPPVYFQGNAPEIPLADGCMDAVLAVMTFHCLPQPGQVIAEAARLLRSGGALVVADVNGRHWMARPFEWVEHRFISPLTHAFDQGELRALTEAAGLVDFSIHHRPGKENGFMQWCVAHKPPSRSIASPARASRLSAT